MSSTIFWSDVITGKSRGIKFKNWKRFEQHAAISVMPLHNSPRHSRIYIKVVFY